jgi:outer membrane protein, heavy metal efflux system
MLHTIRILRRQAGCGVVAAFVTIVAPLTAQQPVSPANVGGQRAAFSISDAVALARRQHPLLIAAGGRRMVVAGAARQESALPNPTLEWRKENLGSPLQRDEFVTAGLPVDVYGRRVALRAASALTGARALADSATTARQVEFEVARAYWRAALAFATRDAAFAQRHAVDTIARIETDRARQGAVPEGSAMRARLEADRARLLDAAAAVEVERARGDLARALALPFDSVPRPTDPLRVDSGVVLPSLEALLTLARSRRPELRSAQTRVDEMSKRQLAERLGTLPAVGVQAGSKRTAGFQTGTVAVGVTIPFFDRNGGNRERARGDVLIAAGDLRATMSTVAAEVTAAERSYRTLLTEFARESNFGIVNETLRELDTRGAAVAKIAATAYREGAIPLFELLDAERVRADVRVAALRAVVDVHLARLELLRAVGLPVDAPQLISSSP